ncbi:hypothetical protein BH09BAC6_BH09BAC6_04090 [soil metagenome]|jgi:ubiquinone/menaquinone biosynthesis C-methylase UbiE
MNPWLSIPYQDYEKHMSHQDVQLQCLNSIIKQKALTYKPLSVAVYGACTGNGFEHFENIETIYAIDINNEFLSVCRPRQPYLGHKLTCITADLNSDEIDIPAETFDLVYCHLFLEYVDIKKDIRWHLQNIKTWRNSEHSYTAG